MESNEEKPDSSSQDSLQKSGHSGGASRELQKSLSTITEETTTTSTKSKLHESSSAPQLEAEEDANDAEKVVQPAKPTSPGSTGSRLREHSIILRHTSQEVKLPRDLEKTQSRETRLLSHISLSGKHLFPTVVSTTSYKTPSLLISGFGLRNLKSLQEALQTEEEHKLKELYRAEAEGEGSSLSSLERSDEGGSKLEISSETQTDTTDESLMKRKMIYLMGLRPEDYEEEGGREGAIGSDGEGEVGLELYGKESEVPVPKSLSVRKAQRYLRVHKIFEFFRFIIAHLLSALPENPIHFIMDLLDKCLIYRSGFTDPPLLYNRNHLECLFYLMDKMRSGYIDMGQYETGMKTIGICSYNLMPPNISQGMIAKDDFVEEAYECLTHLLNDMIKRRWIDTKPPETAPPPPTPQLSSSGYSIAGESEAPLYARTRLFIT